VNQELSLDQGKDRPPLFPLFLKESDLRGAAKAMGIPKEQTEVQVTTLQGVVKKLLDDKTGNAGKPMPVVVADLADIGMNR